MSAVLLHGVVPEGMPRPPQAPAHGRCDAGGLVALTSRPPKALFDDRDGSVTIEVGLAHDSLLSAYARIGPVLPIRFGALFSGPEALRGRVAADAAALGRGLARLGMAREYGVSLLRTGGGAAPSLPARPGGSGRDFLSARAAARRARRSGSAAVSAFLADVESRLGSHAAEIRRTGRTDRERMADLAALVPPEREPDFLRLADALGPEAARHGLALRIAGPWPAYSFCAEASHG